MKLTPTPALKELSALEEYLIIHYENKKYLNLSAKLFVCDLYKQYHVFLGPDRSDWYRAFIKKLESMTEGSFQKDCFYYIKTVDFIVFVEYLEDTIR